MKPYHYIIIILGIIIAILLVDRCKRILPTGEELKAIAILQDSIVHFKDAQGKLQTMSRVLILDNQRQIQDIATKDSLIRRLQTITKHQKGDIKTVLVHDVVTRYKQKPEIGSSRLDSILTNSLTDTTDYVMSDNLVYRFTGFTAVDNEWIKVFYDINGWDVKVINKFNYTVKSVGTGFMGLGHKEHIVTVEDLNPYTQTNELKAIIIQEKKKPIGIGAIIGFGFNTGSFKPAPFIGVGLSYNLINL